MEHGKKCIEMSKGWKERKMNYMKEMKMSLNGRVSHFVYMNPSLVRGLGPFYIKALCIVELAW
jgi:hypothetical protein